MASFVKEVLVEAKTDKKSKIPEPLSDDDLDGLVHVTNLLKPLAELTDRLQGDGVTSSLVIPCLVQTIIGNNIHICNKNPNSGQICNHSIYNQISWTTNWWNRSQ